MPSALPRPSIPPAPEPPPTPSFSWQTLLLLALMLLGMWFWRDQGESKNRPVVDYSAFYQWVRAGDVSDVMMKGSSLDGTLKAPKKIEGTQTKVFHTIAPARDDELLPLLRDKQVKFRVMSEEQPFAVQLLLTLLPWALILGVWLWLSRRAQKVMMSGGPFGNILKPRGKKFEKTASVAVRFDDVAGLQAAKRDLQEVVEFLKEPEKFRRLGGKVPRGVLLVGPPGTGKTLLARAVAGESGVPFYSISAAEFIEMFVGVGAARVRELFTEAKKNAPAIVFIDEIDAVGRSRGAGLGGGHDEREQTLNQLLSEMDGFDRNDLTIVLAATNRPDVLDPALLRPGRFDRHVVVDRPELQARRAILDVHVRGKPLGKEVKLDVVARSTPGFSGADLANLVNEAALHATRRNADSIEQSDFDAAYDKIVLGDPREAKLLSDEKHRVAAHESGHAVLAAFAPYAEPLERVSIIPRGMALGVTRQTPLEDRHLMTQPEIEARLCVLMGGYAAEKLVFGSVSSGAENDLKQASELALKMVAHYGMSPGLGPVYYEHQTEHPFLGQRIATESGTSDATIRAIELEAREVLTRALETAGLLLRQHQRELDLLQKALVERETLERSDLEALWATPAPARVA
ncbi:MAG TPA: ATP-dependent zinc metalloprotease FtsH [Polyangiaceae bacterium]|nr:ATP-dependent zinc metalloprotease FtsH [Polyangiaceae bacterium]